MTEESQDFSDLPQRYAAALRSLQPDGTEAEFTRLLRNGFDRGSLIKIGLLKANISKQAAPAEVQAAIAVVREVELLDSAARQAVDAETLAILRA